MFGIFLPESPLCISDSDSPHSSRTMDSAMDMCPGCGQMFAPGGFSNHLRFSHNPHCRTIQGNLQPRYPSLATSIPIPTPQPWSPALDVEMVDLNGAGSGEILDSHPLNDVAAPCSEVNPPSPIQDNLQQLLSTPIHPPGGEIIILDSDSDDDEEDNHQSNCTDLGPSTDSGTRSSASKVQPRM